MIRAKEPASESLDSVFLVKKTCERPAPRFKVAPRPPITWGRNIASHRLIDPSRVFAAPSREPLVNYGSTAYGNLLTKRGLTCTVTAIRIAETKPSTA
jgi:hypothetical protein